MTETVYTKHYRRNFICLALDYCFFGIAMSFISSSTVIPGFLSVLGASSTVIGLASSLQSASWLLPQLFAARHMADKERTKPHILWPAGIGRALVLLMALVLWITGGTPAWLVISFTLLVTVGLWTSDGLASVPWFDLLGKTIPPQRRGRLSAVGQASSGIMGLLAGAVVEWLLSSRGPGFPNSYVYLLLLGAAMLGLSLVAVSFAVEEGSSAQSHKPSWREFLPELWQVLKTDHAYRRYIITRQLYGLGALASPFYMTYALTRLQLPQQVAGRYTSFGVAGSIVAALVLGWINERYGSKLVIHISIGLNTLVPVLALTIPTVVTAQGWLAWSYGLVFFFYTAAMSSMMTGWMTYVLDLAPASKRATYVGLTNTINGLTTVFATLGGLFLQWTDNNYRALFVITFLGLLTAWPLPFGLPEPRHNADQGA